MREVIDKHKPGFNPSDVRYPFARMSVGDSFTIPLGAKNLHSLRSLSSTAGTLLHMRFKVLLHEEYGLIEVGRIE
jgi:hypothetical protein